MELINADVLRKVARYVTDHLVGEHDAQLKVPQLKWQDVFQTDMLQPLQTTQPRLDEQEVLAPLDDPLLVPLRRAQRLIRSGGDPWAARAACSEAVATTPESPIAHLLLATVLQKAGGSFAEAAGHLRTALELNPFLVPPTLLSLPLAPSTGTRRSEAVDDVRWSLSANAFAISADGRVRVKQTDYPWKKRLHTVLRWTVGVLGGGSFVESAFLATSPVLGEADALVCATIAHSYEGDHGRLNRRTAVTVSPADGSPLWGRKLAPAQTVTLVTPRLVAVRTAGKPGSYFWSELANPMEAIKQYLVESAEQGPNKFTVLNAKTGAELRTVGESTFRQLYWPTWPLPPWEEGMRTARLLIGNVEGQPVESGYLSDPWGLLPVRIYACIRSQLVHTMGPPPLEFGQFGTIWPKTVFEYEGFLERHDPAPAAPVSVRKPSQLAIPSQTVVPPIHPYQITFSVHHQTEFGQEVFVVGELPELGSWDLARAVKLAWCPGHLWTATIAAHLRSPLHQFEYKYALAQNGGPPEWEPGLNRSGRVPVPPPQESTSTLCIHCDDQW